MSPRRDALKADPGVFGFLALLREIERGQPQRPRIGRNQTMRDDIVRLGQDPFQAFPDHNVSQVVENADGKLRVRSNFLGSFGPQGALPLNTTAEVQQWYMFRDEAFVRLADLFTNRFQQLFFRAWSDARGITQYDQPGDDRFQTYVGAPIGLASPALQGRGTVPDMARLPLVGIAMARVKSPARLRQILESLCGVTVEIEENVPVWLGFEPSDLTRLGAANSGLGRDCRLGSRVQSVNEKIRVAIKTESLPQYQSFLPGGSSFQRLTELLFTYLGHETEVEIAPSLPADQIKGVALGKGAALGWTGWLAPPPSEPGTYRSDAVFASDRRSA
ncbi:type VI secretion system baseplate subunit TssG [Cypionkella sp.]|uniref:type VI secretion system baseplate subunit TssG n=1 Tax=Cypionkella sp. TaxID=2811411 RepID=UPI002AB86464|nr:type VI secretion system baseplate subunit TssG [Cypionkella sp.]MDZ4393634.1 type VI secretion system baseplate subunit TssG [Cypionkella sp.]